ncbi:hypothetical protein [uncultured Kordia sp.]|uniref:hypothetical protein n=1 Tax=uncultured Kordia sp. TaxID=507699 RepID=UPI00262725F9|nr:hypothetical protein [uncultured Kordia sp.]
MKLFIQLLTILVISCVKMQAQHIIKVPNIHLIAHNEKTLMMYEQVGLNTFKEIDMEYRNLNNISRRLHIDRDGLTYSLEQLQSRYTTVLFVGHLRSNGFEDLKNKQWFVNTKIIQPHERHIFKFTDSNFVTYQEFETSITNDIPDKYETPYKVIRASMLEQQPTIGYWRIIDQVWYQPIILDFGNEKQIILLNNHIDSDFVFIPLMDEIKIISEEIDIKKTVEIQKHSPSFSPYDYFDHFKFSKLYKKAITKNNTYRILDLFGNDLLEKTFDRIEHNNYYIVGENDGSYTVYDLLLNELEFPNIQKYYFNEYGLEVLTKDEAYYSIEGFRETKYPIKIGGKTNGNNPIISVFPKQKKLTYELLEKVTKSFYKIIKNGKSGWLDITTMEEFFFD